MNTKTIYRLTKNIGHFITRTPAVLLANILVSLKCTQKCLQCTIYENTDTLANMTYEDFVRTTDILGNFGTQFISISGGEPLMNKDLNDMIRYISNKRLIQVQLLTTLYGKQSLVEKTIDVLFETGTNIQVSFDGFGEIADELRGAKNVTETVTRGIDLINRENKKLKKPIRTAVNVVISQKNLRQIPEIINFIEEIGWKTNVDLYRWLSDNHREIDEMKVEDTEYLKNLIPVLKKSPVVTTPSVILDGYMNVIRGTMLKRCPYLDGPTFGSKFFINPEGGFSACMGGAFGNILEEDLTAIFRSEKWHQVLKEIQNCKGCWNSCFTPSAMAFRPSSLKDIGVIIDMIKSK